MAGKIDTAFQGYLKACSLEDCSTEQRRELRQAFFGGASIAFSVIIESAADFPVLEAMQKEIHEFGAQLDERCKHSITIESGNGARASFIDLSDVQEDQRIQTIGERAAAGNVVGCMLERDDHAKVERYVEKIRKRFPSVRLIEKTPNKGGKLMVLKFGPATNA
jgi:hypothetical protein